MPSDTPKLLPKRSALTYVAVSTLAVILVVLAVLQYRWSGQVSRAERERMQEDLNRRTSRFQEEFYSEIRHICTAFQLEPEVFSAKSGEEYAQHYQAWARTADHPKLVTNLYLWETGEGRGPQLVRLDETLKRFEPVEWPTGFADIQRRLPAQRVPEFRRGIPPMGFPPVWRLEEQVPALVHPVFGASAAVGDGMPSPPRFLGEIVIALDMDVVQKEVFPELARRNFSGPEGFLYHVAIASAADTPRVYYRSSPEISVNLSPADAVVDLSEGPNPRRPFDFPREWESHQPPRRPDGGWARPGDGDFSRRPVWHLPRIVAAWDEPGRWRLVVNHRLGSLDAAVASFRRRNLAVSFGILLLLAVSMAMVVVSTGRARKLAQLQMEFVAGVSHELRTPLAVICSAADNLAAGVVEAREQVRQYGTLIGTEGLRLSHMVQQILLFASRQARRARYELRPVRIEEIIDRALAEARSIQGAAEVSIEKSVAPNLPPVMGDANALTHCLENLIGNAIKYGGDSRWISIRGQATRGPRGPELQVIIADRGIGIDETELEHIFEPFYRGRAATAARCPGIGLGLSLAKEVAEAMGGRITVTSTLGMGSSFSLYLPAASETSGPLEMHAA